MRIGYLHPNSARSMQPHVAATELEARGFDSMWVPEHSHYAIDRVRPSPGGKELPDSVWDIRDPLTSLAAAAAVTSSLRLGTGVCLLLQHDLLAAISSIATLDGVSGGRLTLGIGAGWDEAEFSNHRPDLEFRQRYLALEERVRAVRLGLAGGDVSFEGRWDRFSRSRILPPSVQQPVPVALGVSGGLGLTHAARWADAWCPVDVALVSSTGRLDIAGTIARFRSLVVAHGRDPADVPITMFMWQEPTPERIQRYLNLGIVEVVIGAPNQRLLPTDDALRHFDEVIRIAGTFSQLRTQGPSA